MKSRLLSSLGAAAAMTLAASSIVHAQAAPGYHVIHRINAGGEGGWDYVTVDPDGNRLFLSRGTHAMVIDLGRDSVVGDIPNTAGIHGVVLAPELNRGFTSNGRDSSVTIFDYKTLAPIGVVKIPGRNPDAILYDAATKRVFTFNGGTSNATAIDATNGTVVGTVALGGAPETAVSDGGKVYANIEDKSEIAVFDPKTLAVLAHWPLAPCEEPSGLAIDRVHQRLFAGCGNKTMAVVDMRTGKVVATPAVGSGVDAAGFDPGTQLAFTSNGEGTITVVHEDTPDKYTVVETVPTQRGARTMAVNPKTHRLYTVTAEFGPTPAATADRPRPRPPMIPGTFVVLELDR
ncbi:MAG TPA: YncE family protein [Gemmatimonadaceae bacterium]|nr:YncE family protein [Gemmatimonadaceae bacterium]